MESLEEVERLLRRLSGRERDIVRLFYLEGRTYEEISTESNVPVNTIGSVLSRARKKLREMTKKTNDAHGRGKGVKVKHASGARPGLPETNGAAKNGKIPEEQG